MAVGELISAAFKNMNITDIIQLVQVQNLRGLYQRAMGVVKPTSGGGSDDGTKEAKEDGRGMIDELNALIAMAEAHYGASLANMPAEDNTVTRGRFSKLMAIFKKLRDDGKSGGAEKLMHIIGHESHLQGTASIPKAPKGQQPGGQPERIDIHNVRQRTNPAGRLIIRFLTDLQTAEAVELLTASSITDNARDKTAATVKAAADKTDEWRQQWKEWYGKHDTALHELAVLLATDRETLRRITESARAQELRAAVEAAPEGEKRSRHEAYQLYLLEMVKRFQDPVIQAHEARKAGKRTPEESEKRLTRIFVTIIVVGVIILGVAAKFN